MDFQFLLKLKEYFRARDIPAYLVGGCVRDLILGREIRDVDIAVKADTVKITADIAAELGGRTVVLDEFNGIVRLVRTSSSQGDIGPEYVDFSTFSGEIKNDLARRDFTINSMAININDVDAVDILTVLIDPFMGRDDLIKKSISATAADVFIKDPIRMLRAVRFAAELGFTIEEKTELAIKAGCQQISRAPGERLREEICRLFKFPRTYYWLYYLDLSGLLGVIIPELMKTKNVEQPKEHHWQVFDHSVQTVKAVELITGGADDSFNDKEKEIRKVVPRLSELENYFDKSTGFESDRRVLLKLAALLHDVAKPQTKAVAEDNRVHFFGHAEQGAVIAGEVLTRLRFSNQENGIVQTMVKHHLRPTQLSPDTYPTPRAIYRYFRDTGEVAVDTMFLSLADHLATRGPDLIMENFKTHCDITVYTIREHIKSMKETARQPRILTGHDIMDKFNISPGPLVGKLLEAVNEAYGSGEIKTREEALTLVGYKLLSQLEGKI